MSEKNTIVITSAKRTAIGSLGGSLKSVSAHELGAEVISDVIKKTKIKFKYIDLGGGFGISYKKNDKKIKLNNYSKLVYKFKKKFAFK